MTTGLGSAVQEPVAIPDLHHGDMVHISPHEVFRHTEFIHTVACREADVLVDSLLPVEGVIVICWLIPAPAGEDCGCPRVCGAVVYDADDSILVQRSAA